MKSWNLSTIHFYILWLWSLICLLIFPSGVGQSHPMQIPFSQPVVTTNFHLPCTTSICDLIFTWPFQAIKTSDLKKNIPLGPVETTGHNVEKANFCNIIYVWIKRKHEINLAFLISIWNPSHNMAVFHTCSSQLWHNLACSSLENQISILVLGTT